MEELKYILSKGYIITKDGILINPKGVVVKGSINNNKGYLSRYTLVRINGKHKYIPFHRIQAYLKFGEELFKGDIEVRHLNGNSLDNSFDNISIGTHSDNMMDIPSEVRKKKSSLANLKHDHKSIIEDRRKGMKYSKLMDKYNISSKSTISHIVNKTPLC